MAEDGLLRIYYIALCSLYEVMIAVRSLCVYVKLVLVTIMLTDAFMFCIYINLIAPVL